MRFSEFKSSQLRAFEVLVKLRKGGTIKTVVFAFIITTISAYQGYYTKGGTREVGISSTRAVVYSDVVILITNYALTQLLLI